MTYDLKITGGTVVDGTGRPRYRADVGVRDGIIVDVGECGGRADRVIDADGAIVTPGFTDIHCHYDGQVSWDGEMAPSSHHGVTTCVIGNCGVGFAPVRERDQDRLVALMEGVEDIPGTALAEGLTWKWSSFAEYMDAIDAVPRTIDVCAQVPHDALRVFAMGERAIAGEPASEDDIAAMRALLGEALDAGAFGFSTGRTDNHRAADGAPTPSSEASAAELRGIARAFAGRDRGVLQAVSDFDMNTSPALFDGEFDLIEDMARAAGRPLSLSLLQRDAEPGQWKRVIARAERATERGVPIWLQVAPRGIGVLLGLDATFHPFMGFPSYKQIAHLPLAERVRQMADAVFRARVLAETSDAVAGDGSPLPPLADQLLARLDFVAMRLFELDEVPDYEPPVERSLYKRAYLAGARPLEVIYDALLGDDGRNLLYFPVYNYSGFNLDAVGKMLAHPLALPGLSDGGAHVGTICDASFPTFLLTHWARDRARGRLAPRGDGNGGERGDLALETAVKLQARDTARYMGLADRGEIAPGQKADLNVIDLDRLALERPRLCADLPAGGKRLLQGARGYRATIASGQVIAEDGALTDARPGRVVRAGRAR